MTIKENYTVNNLYRVDWWKVLAIISCLMVLSCSASRNDKEEKDNREIIIFLQAGNNINPDKYGNASPVRVILYQLNDKENFFSGDIYSQEELSDKGRLSQVEKIGNIIISPAEKVTLRLPYNKKNKMLGIITEYREITHSVWRLVYPIPRKPKEPWYRVFWPTEENWQPEVTVHLEYLTTSIKK